MKAMDTLQDLIEEAKLRTVWWALCIFAVAYFFSHTSKSMWMNFPISVLLVALLRTLFNKMELKWRVRSEVSSPSYLSHLKRKQLSVNDSRLSTAPSLPKWKRKIDSPLVEAAVDELISKILQDFVIDLWYAEITPDREAPELIRAVIMEALGEISGRVKELNLVDLLTRDLVDLIGDHVELFRKNQAEIGVDVMGTLSCEERDDRLKHHLMASKALHPALISPESEYKVLQRLIGGILAVVLRPKEAQCPLVRCIARELVTCLVLQPVLNLASPVYINELVEHILLTIIDGKFKEAAADQSSSGDYHNGLPVTGKGIQASESTSKTHTPSFKLDTNTIDKVGEQREKLLASNGIHEEHMQPRPADWARVLEAATRRRTEVLMPENLENMWTKGRNYKNKVCSIGKSGNSEPIAKGSGMESSHPVREVENKILNIGTSNSTVREDKAVLPLMHGLSLDAQSSDERKFSLYLVQNSYENGHHVDELEHPSSVDNNGNKVRLKRSNSTSDLRVQSNFEKMLTWEGRGPVIAEYWSPSFYRHNEPCSAKSASNLGFHSEGQYTPKLRCRVLGAYFEKIASKSFAVYSIAVTNAGNNTWFVKRRYSNFERLHRHLKDIPNYTLHLPPKRIFSSSTEDAFVHQRCIQLDRYLLDLLSIANVAEQHEVWDFLSASSKNYSFGKSSSVMRTLAVNVDDAVDDIVRQFKGVSDGLMRKVVGSSTPHEASPSISAGNLSWHTDDNARHNDSETTNNFSDNEEYDKDAFHEHDEVDSVEIATGWHSDNELNSKGFPPRVIKQSEKASKHGDGRKNFNGKKKQSSTVIFEGVSLRGFDDASFPVTADYMEDPACMPPEWTPPNVSVPILNLVDKIFQLKRRGWLRRQVFWISKQILQLMMEDAIDDWLLRQIRWLRRENVIAQGIRWVQDVIWPDGTFFLRPRCNQGDIYDGKLNQSASVGASNLSRNGSFEQQLEAARRASNVKKLIFDGAPTALVSLIGSKQYKRCAKDIYYFLQSTICIKQVTFGVLELVIISIFPELRDLVVDIHKQMRAQAL